MLDLLLKQETAQVSLEEYRSKVLEFRAMAERSGVRIPAGAEGDWRQLKGLAPEIQQAIFHYFNCYFAVCQDVLNSGTSLTNDRQLFWRMLGKLKLRPDADLFNHIADGDVIEIYDRNGFQVFRNLAFFSVSSYSFEQLMHFPMPQLFSRAQKETEVILAEMHSVLNGTSGPVLHSRAGTHTVVELMSKEKFEASMKQKIMSPLYGSDGEIAALVATLRVLSLRPTAVTNS